MFDTALSYLASFIRTYMHEICFGITAVTLVLIGPYINSTLRKLVKKLHWFLRYVVFVIVCTAGYTFLGEIAYQGVKTLLTGCSNPLLVLITLIAYLILAWIAKEQKMI